MSTGPTPTGKRPRPDPRTRRVERDHRVSSPDRDYSRAWWSMSLYLVSILAAFVVGEGLASLYGYESGDEMAPLWVALAAGGPAIVVLALPAVVVAHFGLRARRGGRRDAWVPLAVGVGLPVLFLLQNLLAYVVGRLID